jgi:hypothetical protein
MEDTQAKERAKERAKVLPTHIPIAAVNFADVILHWNGSFDQITKCRMRVQKVIKKWISISQ